MRDTKVLPTILVSLLLAPWIHGQEFSSRDQREAQQLELLRFVEAEFPEARIDVRFEASSRNAMATLRFEPKIIDGKPVKRTGVVYPIDYRILDDDGNPSEMLMPQN